MDYRRHTRRRRRSPGADLIACPATWTLGQDLAGLQGKASGSCYVCQRRPALGNSCGQPHPHRRRAYGSQTSSRTHLFAAEHLDISRIIHHDAYMRTTLTLDDDIAHSLKERARLLNKPFKQVVNDALRRGISPAVRETPAPYRVVPHHSGFVPGVDPLRLNQLNDELEVEDFLEQEAR